MLSFRSIMTHVVVRLFLIILLLHTRRFVYFVVSLLNFVHYLVLKILRFDLISNQIISHLVAMKSRDYSTSCISVTTLIRRTGGNYLLERII